MSAGTEQRKLAAIMFTDMVGYSALSQRNEALALELLEEHRRVVRSLLPRHGGREVKTTGDGFLLEFPSALAAVQGAVEIQNALHARNQVSPSERQLRIRIGIHVGDVVMRDGDIHGDVVNIAARIEPLAAAGGICVSEDVERQVHNKLPQTLTALGPAELKNIVLPVVVHRVVMPWETPSSSRGNEAHSQRGLGSQNRLTSAATKFGWIAVLLLLAIGGGWWFVHQSGKATKQAASSSGATNAAPVVAAPIVADQKSIAVLPFVNLSADKENEFLSDGITEEILNTLTKVPGLRVPARTSSFVFKGKTDDIKKIGELLRVATVLEGSVQRSGNQLRVTAQLINVADGYRLWSERYDREMTNIFDIQDDIARTIVAKLKLTLAGPAGLPSAKRGTAKVEAYELYLKGIFFLNRRTEDDLNKARQLFDEAIGVDPGFAVAYAGVADCYNALGYLNYLAPTNAFPKAKAAASKALEMDERLPAAHAALGYYFMYHEFDFARAGQEFQTAIELDPNYVTARHNYSIYLTAVGRQKDAREEIERAQKLDVLSVPVTTDMGFQLHYGGRQEEAIRQLESALEMNPQFPAAHFWLGRIYTTLQWYDQALAEYEKVPALQTWQPMMAAKGYLYGVWDKPDEARKILADFEARRSQNLFVTSYGVALVHAGMGNQEEALRWLENALAEKSHWLIWLKLDPRWTRLRTEPRFQALVIKVGLTP